MRRKELLANIALLLCAALWGFNFIFQKQASQHLGAFTFISLRYYIGVLSLLPLLFYLRKHSDVTKSLIAAAGIKQWHGKRFALAALAASLCNWGGAVLVQIGLHTTDAARAGFISSAYIAIVPLLDFLIFRKKASYRIWVGIAMAMMGLYLLCIAESSAMSPGDLAIVGGTFCFAAHILLWSRFSPYVDGLAFIMTEFLCTGTLSGIIGLITETTTWGDLSACLVSLLFAGVLGVGVTYTIQIYAQRFTSASMAALLMSMESVFSSIGGVLILHETLTAREWTGCFIMFATILYVQMPAPKKKRQCT